MTIDEIIDELVALGYKLKLNKDQTIRVVGVKDLMQNDACPLIALAQQKTQRLLDNNYPEYACSILNIDMLEAHKLVYAADNIKGEEVCRIRKRLLELVD